VSGPVWGMAWSPDGAQLAYVVAREGRPQIYRHTLDRAEDSAIPGTEGGLSPFYSPDGRWLGFHDASLKKIPVDGGPPILLCDPTHAFMGASWDPDRGIVFARDTAGGLYRVGADGGTSQALTTLDPSRHESSHRFPVILPGGKAVVFTVKPDDALSWDDARVESASLRTGERSILFKGGADARYVAPGYLVYHRTGSLWAVPFDPLRVKVTGAPLLMLEGVSSSLTFGGADFALSADGSLAYLAGKPRGAGRRLVRVDRAGIRHPVTDLRRGFRSLRLSPDGRRLALQITGPVEQVWVYDLERGTQTPLTSRADNLEPIWTPDGSRLTFSSQQGPTWSLSWQPADGSGPAERLSTSAGGPRPFSWSPDGRSLVYSDGPELLILPRDGDRKPRSFLHVALDLQKAVLSPDGRWLAYASNESGEWEVYVAPFPSAGRRFTISTDGGIEPVWARNGRELYYRNRNRMMAVTVNGDATFSASKPRPLFEAAELVNVYSSYDVTPEGEFVMIEAGESELPSSQINVVLNWARELRERVAAAR
jgi:Tol biopolymer transport system component